MKVLKIVGEGADALHYVEGGPACKPCGGLGSWDKMKAQGYAWPGKEYGNDLTKDCTECHGTGLTPVEQYSDEQLDAFLNTHFETWDLRMRRELHTNEPIYSVEGRPDGFNMPCDDTSRGAKIWAVIAVAEEDK